MADYDTEHALFVRQEYRYAEAKDTSVKAKNASSSDMTINTQLSEASATALAEKYLAENKSPRIWEVTVKGIILPDSFVDGPPAFLANLPSFKKTSGVLKVVSIDADFAEGTTVIEVIG